MDADGATVLIVDDDPLAVDLLEQELGAHGYRTVPATGGEEAIATAERIQPDLILLDVMMAGIDGFETCRRLKTDERTRAVPVVFLTALAQTFDKVRAFRAGAVDYLTKPFETEELLARVGTHIALRREIEAHRRSRAAIQYLLEGGGADRGAILGDSPAVRRVREQIAQVAGTDSTVLIQGETGTGKELVARALHELSARRGGPLIRVNCAALPRELVESELFGHEKGAFTGALQQRRGRFELADGGTLLLDEIGELPLEAQSKLLRVLQEREFERVGGTRSVRVDVRVVAATNRALPAEVAAGRFRADLFYRLDVFRIVVPPLRERREDIPLLVRHVAERIARRLGRTFNGVADGFLARAVAYDWPGNIRELENAVERALIVSGAGHLEAEALTGTMPGALPGAPPGAPPVAAATPEPPAATGETLAEIERSHIRQVLDSVRWRVEGERGAAARLGLHPSTLRGRMRKLGIRKTG